MDTDTLFTALSIYGWVNSKSAASFQWLSALPGSEAWNSSGKFAWNLRKKKEVLQEIEIIFFKKGHTYNIPVIRAFKRLPNN